MADVVVLPEPWRPAIRITVGGFPNASRESPEPIRVGQLLVDDLHDLLAGVEALQDVLAGRALADLRDEVLDDLEVDVGLEQREPDLAHRLRDRLLVEAALAAEVAEGVLELV